MRNLSFVAVLCLLFVIPAFGHPLPPDHCDGAVNIAFCYDRCVDLANGAQFFWSCWYGCAWHERCDNPFRWQSVSEDSPSLDKLDLFMAKDASSTPSVVGTWVAQVLVQPRGETIISDIATMKVFNQNGNIIIGDIYFAKFAKCDNANPPAILPIKMKFQGSLTEQGVKLWSFTLVLVGANENVAFSVDGSFTQGEIPTEDIIFFEFTTPENHELGINCPPDIDLLVPISAPFAVSMSLSRQ